MEDRGFTVADLFQPIGVRLVLPSFLNGQEQLSAEDTVLVNSGGGGGGGNLYP